MAQALQPETGTAPGAALGRKPGADPREPATAAALWPTFMRRTLAEETLRTPQRPAAEATPGSRDTGRH